MAVVGEQMVMVTVVIMVQAVVGPYFPEILILRVRESIQDQLI
jgi:hypothetical protein